MEFDPQLSRTLKGDPGRIKQILMNLIGNAVKFTQKGYVKVKFIKLEEDESSLTFKCEVEDTGIGISPSVIGRLFQPFVQADESTTRKYGGTGLGLSISKRLVELMGGEMGVNSIEGQGSTFWFRLRLPKSKNTVNAQGGSEAQAMINRDLAKLARILVVEDNKINQLVISKMIVGLGFNVDVVSSGPEALQCLLERPYDLMMLDCHMPQMDGYTVAGIIRQGDPYPQSIPIVAFTADAMKGDREKCLEAGMNDYLVKPISKAKFIRVLLKWVPALGQNKEAA